jgi:SAM-dependent methyltransferase
VTALDAVGEARLALLRLLAREQYGFVAPAPSAYRRVLGRRGPFAGARDLEDVFGWNMPFHLDVVGDELFELMQRARMLARRGGMTICTLAVAKAGGSLYLHTAFRAKGREAVFFGPDSYRFIDFIRANLPGLPPGARVLDVGAGAGAGGLFAASQAGGLDLTLADSNPQALALAATNAAFAGLRPRLTRTDGLSGLGGTFDLILANPPYIAGGGEPTYSGGGGRWGEQVSLDWTRQALERLAPGGRLLLYTGAAVVRGRDVLRDPLAQIAEEAGCSLTLGELDADVFPGLLLKPRYWGAERIAAFGAVMVQHD